MRLTRPRPRRFIVRILVTGGTGYLGRAIVHALHARGHDVVVFARAASRAGLPGAAADGDVRDRDALVSAARGCDALCHAAALVSLWRRHPRDFDDVNVGGLENAIAAARAASLSRIVYTSSFLALPPRGASAPLRANDYQRTKAAALVVARRAQADHVPLVILFPGVVYGPGVMSEGNLLGRLLADHAAGRLPGLIGPDRIWSYAWVDDVARAHAAAVEHPAPRREYELGGENVAQIRPFEIVRVLTGRRLPRRIPYPVATLIGRVEELRARLTGASPLLTRATVEIFRHDWPVGAADAGADLGYLSRSLEDGVRLLLQPNQTT